MRRFLHSPFNRAMLLIFVAQTLVLVWLGPDIPPRAERAVVPRLDRRAHLLFGMTHTTTVALPPQAVLSRAKAFFAERVPHASAFVEKEGPTFVTLRGQGGEEIAISAVPLEGGRSRLRAGTLFFDQAVDRFLSTLPLDAGIEVA